MLVCLVFFLKEQRGFHMISCSIMKNSNKKKENRNVEKAAVTFPPHSFIISFGGKKDQDKK